MNTPRFNTEGRVEVEGGTIWYGICGDPRSGATPLVLVHGGPGMSHDYLTPLSALARDRAVIFYDQLDAGKSDRPKDPALWRVPRFVDEIDHLTNALGLERYDLFGNSWGGTVAAAQGARRPAGLRRLVLSSPLLNTARWIADNARYRAALPEAVIAVMDDYEARGETDAPPYLEAVDNFYARHFCRIDPWPDEVMRTFDTLNGACYAGMWGPNEFTCTGVLKDYDGTPDLPRIACETLVTCGAYDEATPESCAEFAAMIPNARLEVFEDASHLAFVERPEAYIATLRAFLDT